MIDIHTHILPGVDDGVQDLGDALLMVDSVVEQGVHTVVATPHLYWGERQALRASHIRQAVHELNELIQANGKTLRVLPGCEIPICADLPERLQQDEWMSIGDSQRAVLVEPPWHEWPAYATPVLQRLISTGWVVVLAHPERSGLFRRDLSLLAELVGMGVHLQVTTSSLIGGRASASTARFAYELMERRLVSVVASDCHDATHRRCDMRDAYEVLKRTYGKHVAQMLTSIVPEALLRGEKVDLSQVWQKVTTINDSRWKRWFRAVLRRQTDDG